jgi:hypothetical protein
MLSTERIFGDACTRVFDELWNDKGKNECCQLKGLSEVPFSKFQLNAEEKTKCAVPATNRCNRLCKSSSATDSLLQMTTCRYNIRRRYMRWSIYTYFWWQIRSFEADPFLVPGSPANAAVSVVRTWFEVGFTPKSPATFRRCKRWHYGAFSPPPPGRGSSGRAFTSSPSEFSSSVQVKLWPWWS